MIVDIILLLVGLFVLYLGAEAMVKGASQLALAFGISPFIVGLTVVAFGTSAPEFVVSFLATWQQSEGISVGNIVGSNICNVALILGVAALIQPLSVDASSLRREYPIMLLSSIVFFAMAYDGVIARWEGAILMLGIVGFVGYNMLAVRRAHKLLAERAAAEGKELSEDELMAEGPDIELPDSDDDSSTGKNIAYVVAGIVALALGAHFMVESAKVIARAFGLSDFVIGITIIAFGTSLPELATSCVAAIRKQADISIGNVIGSNIFNVLFVIGSVSSVFTLNVEPQALRLDFPIMLGVLLLAFPLMRFGYRIGRFKGAILLAIYLAYIGYLLVMTPNAGA